jgi:hypothetical protein
MEAGTPAVGAWLTWYYLATYLIAVIALVSLYISINSSKKVSEALKTIQRGLTSLTDPLIKFVGYTWITDTGTISRETPPTGIMFTYQNLSNVPVIVTETDFRVFYGEKELNDIVSTFKDEEGGTQILAPAQNLQSGTIQKELFQKYLSTPKNPMDPPHLFVEFSVKFQSLGTRDHYLYKTKQMIFFSCTQPNFKGGKAVYETIEAIRS